MESSRASSMAQLSAWTSAMKNNDSKNVQPRSQSKQIVEDEYDEEFEDYDEDFEDESPVKVPPPKTESNKTADPPSKSVQNNHHNNVSLGHATYAQSSSSTSAGAKNLSSR